MVKFTADISTRKAINKQSSVNLRLSIVVCTLNREEVLCATMLSLCSLLNRRQDCELIVVDQTRQHTETTERCLNDLAKDIRWERVEFACLTRARNHGVRLARGEIILFLDDDIEPSSQLIDEHLAWYEKPEIWGVAGCVLLPGKKRKSRGDFTSSELHGIKTNRSNRFDLDWPRTTSWASGCNMSFRRERIVAVGGFDEAFYGAAIGEEVEFCYRIRKAGGVIQYAPAAELIHLVNPTGGCRDTRFGEERVAQGLDSICYMFSKMESGWVLKWRNILWHCFIITVNKKSLREWSWPMYLVWCVKGLHRALRGRKMIAKLPFLEMTRETKSDGDI